MTQSAIHQQPDSYYRANARAYLRSLVSGVRPDIRPEFGRYERAMCSIESAFLEIKPGEHAKILPRSIKTISRISANKQLKLLELLTEQGEDVEDAGQQQASSDLLGMPMLPEEARIPPAVAKDGCPWLDEFIEYSKQVSPEGYEDFHEGVGLWDLSVTVAGRASVFHGSRGVGTSLNIGLAADTTMTAKTETANVGVDVLEAADLAWMLGADETTPQKMLSDMAGDRVPTNYENFSIEKQSRIEKRLALAGQRGWFYDEFGSLLRSMGRQNGPMADFKGLLLKVDGCMKTYTYATKTSGNETINNPRLSLLCCMTLPDLKVYMKNGGDDLANGFLPRFALICPPADLMIDKPFDLKRRPVPTTLTEPLRALHERLGMPEFALTVEHDEKSGKTTGYTIDRGDLPVQEIETSDAVRDAWIRYRSALKQLVTPVNMRDFRGFYGRYPTLALRIATLFACLEGLTTIEMRHWAKAQEITERWRKSLHELYLQVNTNEIQKTLTKTIEDKILDYITANQHETAVNKKPTLRNLNRFTGASYGMLKQVLIELIRAQEVVEVKKGKATCYVLNELEDD